MDSNKIEGSNKHYFLRPISRLDRHGRKPPRDDRVIDLTVLPTESDVMGECVVPSIRRRH